MNLLVMLSVKSDFGAIIAVLMCPPFVNLIFANLCECLVNFLSPVPKTPCHSE